MQFLVYYYKYETIKSLNALYSVIKIFNLKLLYKNIKISKIMQLIYF
jgi:hypothetical protein